MIKLDLKLQKEAMDGIDFIMDLNHTPRFPRTIATGATSRRQYTVNSRDEALTYFQAALYQDCYMNAYLDFDEIRKTGYYSDPSGLPMPKPVPNYLLIDLDKQSFESDEAFAAAVDVTLENIKANFTGLIANYPIVIW